MSFKKVVFPKRWIGRSIRSTMWMWELLTVLIVNDTSSCIQSHTWSAAANHNCQCHPAMYYYYESVLLDVINSFWMKGRMFCHRAIGFMNPIIEERISILFICVDKFTSIPHCSIRSICNKPCWWTTDRLPLADERWSQEITLIRVCPQKSSNEYHIQKVFVVSVLTLQIFHPIQIVDTFIDSLQNEWS